MAYGSGARVPGRVLAPVLAATRLEAFNGRASWEKRSYSATLVFGSLDWWLGGPGWFPTL